MTQLSKEQLLEIVETDHVQCGEASAMAKMLLAAEAQEPVAWVTEGWVQNRACEWGESPEGKSTVVASKYWDIDTFGGNEEWLKEAIANTGAKPLYAAPQPAPVAQPVQVPEPITRNDADGWWMYKGRRVGGGCAEWYNRALEDCRAAMLQPSSWALQLPDDTRRMDWLVSKAVNVREPLVYGSHSLFWSQAITDEEDDYYATKLREQIDAAMAEEQPAAPQEPAK